LCDNFLELNLIVIFNLAKRLTEKQKEEIKINFLDNQSVEFLSEKFNCTKTTIIRNLKKSLGEIKYKEILNKVGIKVVNRGYTCLFGSLNYINSI